MSCPIIKSSFKSSITITVVSNVFLMSLSTWIRSVVIPCIFCVVLVHVTMEMFSTCFSGKSCPNRLKFSKHIFDIAVFAHPESIRASTLIFGCKCISRCGITFIGLSVSGMYAKCGCRLTYALSSNGGCSNVTLEFESNFNLAFAPFRFVRFALFPSAKVEGNLFSLKHRGLFLLLCICSRHA